MSSRGKKKKQKAAGHDPGADPNDAPPTNGEEKWFEMFIGAAVLFLAVGGLMLEVFGSSKVALGGGIAGAILAVVLVRRGETLF